MEFAAFDSLQNIFNLFEQMPDTDFYDESKTFPVLPNSHIINNSYFFQNDCVFTFDQELNGMIETLGSVADLRKDKSELMKDFLSFYSNKRDKYDQSRKRFIIAILTTLILDKNYFSFISIANYNIFIDTSFFPSDPTDSKAFDFIYKMNYFLYQFLISVNIDCRLKLFSLLDNFWIKNGNKSLYNFIPLLNKLGEDWKINSFYNYAPLTQFFSHLLSEAKDDEVIFGVVYRFIRANVKGAFNTNILVFMPTFFNNPKYREDVCGCLSYGMNKAVGLQKDILIAYFSILHDFIPSKDIESAMVFLNSISSCFRHLDLQLLQFEQTTLNIFLYLSKFSLLDENMFFSFLEFLYTMNNRIEIFDSASYDLVFKNLRKFPMRKELINKLLYPFTLTDRVVIQNWRGIELLISFYDVDELGIIKIIQDLSQIQRNIVELDRAKVPKFIINRLIEIQENDELRTRYLAIYEAIITEIFRIPDLFRTVELMKSKDFHFPSDILSIFNRILFQSKDNHNRGLIKNVSNKLSIDYDFRPSSFFRFDKQGNSITGPEIKKLQNFVLCFSLRFNKRQYQINNSYLTELNEIVENTISNRRDSKLTKKKPDGNIFSIIFSTNWQLIFSMENNRFYLTDTNKNIKKEFENIKLEEEKWYFFELSSRSTLLKRTFTLRINKGENIDLIRSAPNKTNNNGKNSSNNETGFVSSFILNTKSMVFCKLFFSAQNCDFTSVFLFDTSNDNNNTVEKFIKQKMNQTNLPEYLSQRLICCFNCLSVHEDQILNTNILNENAFFKGRYFPSNPSFFDTIQSIGVVNSFLSLFSRLDNSFETAKGQNFLNTLIQIFKFSESLSSRPRIFELFSIFLNKINPKFFSTAAVESIFDLYDSLKSKESFSNSIFYNFNLISTFPNELQKFFIEKVTKLNDNVKCQSFDLFLFQAIELFFEESETSKAAWKLIAKVFDPNNPDDIDSIVMVSMRFVSDYVTINCLEIILDHLQPILKYTSKFSWCATSLILINRTSSDLKILAILILAKMITISSFDPLKYIYQMTFVSSPIFPSDSVAMEIYKVFIPDNGIIIKNVNFFPLLVVFSSFCTKSTIEYIVDGFSKSVENYTEAAFEIVFLNSWEYWITNFLLLKYRAILSSTKKSNIHSNETIPIIDVFQWKPLVNLFKYELSEGSSVKLNSFFNFLSFYSAQINVEFREIKRLILLDLLNDIHMSLNINNNIFEFKQLPTNNSKNQQNKKNALSKKHNISALFPTVFNFLVVTISTQKLEEKIKMSPLIQSNTSDFTNKFEISVSMNSFEDSELASLIIRAVLILCNLKEKVKVCDIIDDEIIIPTCFLVSKFFTNKLDSYSTFVGRIVNEFPNLSNAICQKCASMLIGNDSGKENNLFNEGVVNNYPILSEYKNNSATFDYLNIIIDSFSSFTIYQQNCLTNLQNNLADDISSISGFTPDIEMDENMTIVMKLLSISDINSFQYFFYDLNSYFIVQKSKLDNKKQQMNRVFESFVNEYTNINDTSDKKYKIMNQISLHGYRILMSINNNFNDHKNPALNTKDTINKKDNLKPLPFLSEIASFNAKVFYKIIRGEYEGTLQINNGKLIFVGNTKSVEIDISSISFIFNRTISNIDKSCEIFTNKNRSFYFTFIFDDRDRFYKSLPSFSVQQQQYIDNLEQQRQSNEMNELNDCDITLKYDFFWALRSICHSIFQNESSQSLFKKLKLIEQWQNYKISTFEYIYYLNVLSDRSYHSVDQYPVFPMLIKDTESFDIDLNNSNIYRDLSLPMRFFYKERDKRSQCEAGLSSYAPSCSPAIHRALIRIEPFTTLEIMFQNNKFDKTDRLFYNIHKKWSQYFVEGNVEESPPEFFCFPHYLKNECQFDFGIRSNGEEVDSVVLPNWAKNHYIYTSSLRIALESNFVSSKINKWIDFTFGPIRNTFEGITLYPPECIPENFKHNEENKLINCVGVLPNKLYDFLHPSRFENLIKSQQHIEQNESSREFNIIEEYPFLRKIPEFFLCKLNKNYGIVVKIIKEVVQCRNNNNNNIVIDVHEYPFSAMPVPTGSGDLICVSFPLKLAIFLSKVDPFVTVLNLRLKKVTLECQNYSTVYCASTIGGRYLLTGGNDCTIRVWDMLKNFTLVSCSCFHTDEIEAIGGCRDNGIIVSVDRAKKLIIESLFGHKFLAAFKLEKEDYIPILCVTKAGYVIIGQKNKITFLDSRGKPVFIKSNEGKLDDIRKYYDYDSRELLIIGYHSNIIEVFDLTTFLTVVKFEADNFHFCPMKNCRAILISKFNTLYVNSFDHYIPSVIVNYKEGEEPSFPILKESF